MKTGIYLPGLAEAFIQQSTVSYATRIMQELDHNLPDASATFYLKQEKETYGDDQKLETNVVNIYQRQGETETLVYRLYDFDYAQTLTSRFNNFNVLIKAILLFGTVLSKVPMVLLRLVYGNRSQAYARKFRFISAYALLILFVLALFGLSLLPAAFTLFSDVLHADKDGKIQFSQQVLDSVWYQWFTTWSLKIVSVSTVLFTLVPTAKNFLSQMASEFVSANSYLQFGQQAQHIHGHFDRLIEHICEKEGGDVRIHIHAYSFGSTVTLDHLFPIGNTPSLRLQQHLECVITIGCPYDFINNFYPVYYRERNLDLQNAFRWYNVYSITDAMGTNFRSNNSAMNAEYSIGQSSHLPVNIRYEVSNVNPYNPLNFIRMQSLQAHQCYWDTSGSGQSCLRQVVKQLKTDGLL